MSRRQARRVAVAAFLVVSVSVPAAHSVGAQPRGSVAVTTVASDGSEVPATLAASWSQTGAPRLVLSGRTVDTTKTALRATVAVTDLSPVGQRLRYCLRTRARYEDDTMDASGQMYDSLEVRRQGKVIERTPTLPTQLPYQTGSVLVSSYEAEARKSSSSQYRVRPGDEFILRFRVDISGGYESFSDQVLITSGPCPG